MEIVVVVATEAMVKAMVALAEGSLNLNATQISDPLLGGSSIKNILDRLLIILQ